MANPKLPPKASDHNLSAINKTAEEEVKKLAAKTGELSAEASVAISQAGANLLSATKSLFMPNTNTAEPKQLTEKPNNKSAMKEMKKWPSETDEPLKPFMDKEAKQREQIVAASTVGGSLLLPLGGITSYVGTKIATTTPSSVPQPDLSGIKDKAPQSMPELVEALLGKNTRNRGIVFGDTNHNEKGIHKAVFDKEGLEVLKRNGVTHIFLEQPPNQMSKRIKPKEYDPARHFYLLSEHYTTMQKNAKKLGITVVGVDMYGPATKKFFESGYYEGFDTTGLSENEVRHYEECEKAFSEERARVTTQVWVPRVTEVMKKNPEGKFVAIGGAFHTENPVLLNSPDIVHTDYDEALAQSLNAPVPYVRITSNGRPGNVSITKGRAESYRGDWITLDTPEFCVNVPRECDQLLLKSAFKDKPDEVRKYIANYVNEYNYNCYEILRFAFPDTDGTKKDRRHNAIVTSLHKARDLALEGKFEAADKQIIRAQKAYDRIKDESDKSNNPENVQGMPELFRHFNELRRHVSSIKQVSTQTPIEKTVSPFGGLSDFMGVEEDPFKLPPCDAPGAPNLPPGMTASPAKETKR